MIQVPVGVAFQVLASFADSDGVLLDTLSPAPTFTLLSPPPTSAVLVNAQTMTQDDEDPTFWYYNVPAETTTVSGGHRAIATCTDTDVANSPARELILTTTYNLDLIQAKTDLITSGTVYLTPDLDPDTLVLSVIRGDDYTDEVGRAKTWDSDDWTVYDLLNAQSITFKAILLRTEAVFTKAMTAVDATHVKLELTSENTSSFEVTNRYEYEIEVVTQGGDIVSIVPRTPMRVTADIR